MKSILRIGKAFICLAFALLLFLDGNSQTIWDTLPWKSNADYKLQQLNKNYVSTGILYDRVFPYANVDEHIPPLQVLSPATDICGMRRV